MAATAAAAASASLVHIRYECKTKMINANGPFITFVIPYIITHTHEHNICKRVAESLLQQKGIGRYRYVMCVCACGTQRLLCTYTPPPSLSQGHEKSFLPSPPRRPAVVSSRSHYRQTFGVFCVPVNCFSYYMHTSVCIGTYRVYRMDRRVCGRYTQV